MSTASNPPASGDSVPGAPPSVPGIALWSDSDSGRPASPGFAGLVASPTDRAMPTIGHIGRYALKYQLGAGGLGTVFAAHDPLLSRLIAVKTLNVEIKEEERESFNALFINEARAAGGLSHPHIVTVFDAGISDNRAYIAMELLKGRDLRQLRQEGWRATPAQAALIVRRVADALAFAHSKGVIHRDIKPANIFMVGRTQPRVLDFGIARVAHQRDGDTMHGAGSPYYMAPEQIRREPADRRADVFSLGVVLYELLTDEKPFHGDSLKAITTAVLTHEPPLASKVDGSVPKALAEIAARAMAKDPEQRFRSARSFARELRQWLDANPVAPEGEAAPSTAAGAASAPARRRSVVAGAVLGLVAVLAAGFWWQRTSPAATAAAITPSTVAVRPTTSVRPPAATPAPVAATALPSTPVPQVTSAAAPTSPSTTPSATPSTTPGTSAAATTAAATAATDSLLLATIVPTTPINAGRPPAAAAAEPVTAPAPRRADIVAANGAPVTTAAVPSTAPTTAAATLPPLRETAREKRLREAKERETRDREARLAAATQVPPATGTVRIAVSPWGQVEVDGAATGAAPPLTELTLAEGRHQIVIRNGEFTPFVATVNVVPGQPVSLRHKFGA